MGFYSDLDIDMQELQEAHEAAAQDVHDACLGGMSTEQWMPAFRANLGEKLAELGWITPTEADVARRKIKTALEATTNGDTATAGYYLTSVATLLGVDVDADVEV